MNIIFFYKKIFLKIKYISRYFFFNSTVNIHLGKRYIGKMYFEKKLNKIEMKMPKFRNIPLSHIPTTPGRNYKQVVITYIIIRYLYSLHVKPFTNEVDILRKLAS
jgi:hypothetical protein